MQRAAGSVSHSVLVILHFSLWFGIYFSLWSVIHDHICWLWSWAVVGLVLASFAFLVKPGLLGSNLQTGTAWISEMPALACRHNIGPSLLRAWCPPLDACQDATDTCQPAPLSCQGLPRHPPEFPTCFPGRNSIIWFGLPLRRMQLKRLIMNIIRGLTLLFYPTGMMIDDESLPPSPPTPLPQPNSDLQLTEKKNSLVEML